MKVKYRIIGYPDYVNPVVLIENEKFFDNEISFNNLIDSIIMSHTFPFKNIEKTVLNLLDLTWGKFYDEEFIKKYTNFNNYEYEWLEGNIEEIQKSFKLFDNELEIIVNGPGIGETVGEKEGIQFIIHSNEKDKHKYNPHVHAIYQDEELFISIKYGSILNSRSFKSPRKTKVAVKWVMDNQHYLLDSWNKTTDSDLCLDISFNI